MSVPNILQYKQRLYILTLPECKAQFTDQKKVTKVQTVQTELSIKDRKYRLTLKLLGISEKCSVIQSFN